MVKLIKSNDEKITFGIGDEKITFGIGDLVTCHSGVKSKWDIKNPIKKHYKFGD